MHYFFSGCPGTLQPVLINTHLIPMYLKTLLPYSFISSPLCCNCHMLRLYTLCSHKHRYVIIALLGVLNHIGENKFNKNAFYIYLGKLPLLVLFIFSCVFELLASVL